jgi:hypothetical protein
MDEAVRREYLRLRANGSPGPSGADPIDRQGLLQRMGDLLAASDLEAAKAVREEFAMRTARRADPTQAEGTYDRFLDQDDCYLQVRRRAMAPRPRKP